MNWLISNDQQIWKISTARQSQWARATEEPSQSAFPQRHSGQWAVNVESSGQWCLEGNARRRGRYDPPHWNTLPELHWFVVIEGATWWIHTPRSGIPSLQHDQHDYGNLYAYARSHLICDRTRSEGALQFTGCRNSTCFCLRSCVCFKCSKMSTRVRKS